jgi:phosphoserine aminotransferase
MRGVSRSMALEFLKIQSRKIIINIIERRSRLGIRISHWSAFNPYNHHNLCDVTTHVQELSVSFLSP